MYEIYINDNPLLLMNKETYFEKDLSDSSIVKGRYTGSQKQLFWYIDLLEKSVDHPGVWLYGPDVEQLFGDFKDIYKIVEAAGGLVYNQDNKILAIYRRGSWDLPKGKIDPGESKEEAAVREVIEETGLEDVIRNEFLLTTYHTYRNRKNKRVLKPTYWYKMKTQLTEWRLQTEEDIEDAEWGNPADILADGRPIFKNIKKILEFTINED